MKAEIKALLFTILFFPFTIPIDLAYGVMYRYEALVEYYNEQETKALPKEEDNVDK